MVFSVFELHNNGEQPDSTQSLQGSNDFENGNNLVTEILKMTGSYWDQPVLPALHKLLVYFPISVFSTTYLNVENTRVYYF